MVRGAIASVALGAAMLWQSGAALGETPQPEKQGVQPTQEKKPQAAPAQGQPQVVPENPKQPGVTELPAVKVAPAPAEEPKPKPKPRVAAKPTREPPRAVARPASARPAPVIAPAAVPQAEAASAEAVQGVPVTPVKGSEIPIDKVPGAVAQVTSAEVERSGSPAIEQAIQQNVPGAIISDVTGNGYSTDIQYRGFSASPVEGTPQGLAVYQNGVRINEVFGDTVNWDLIPSSAINSLAVVSGNPLYGLNALGGALNITMKDGFGFQGVESDTRVGSYGRFQEFLQLGKQVDNFAAYAAVEGIWDQGWRQFSPSEVRRAYFDLGVKDKDTELHINFTGAENALGAVGPTPVQLLGQDYTAVWTNPQTTTNELAMVSANGSTKLSDTVTLSGVAYLRSYHQQRVDGNVSEVTPCTGRTATARSTATTPTSCAFKP